MAGSRKVALVTGAGRGIGRSIALHLAENDFDLAIHYGSSHGKATEVVGEIESRGGNALAIQGDLSRITDIEHVFEMIDHKFGRLHALVNNAGVVLPSRLEALEEVVFDKVFAVNVKGAAFAAREAAKRLSAGGRIVNITSSRTHFPAAGTTCYAGSKGAVETLTRIWAAELGGRGITVNAVAPGPTTPGMIDRAPEALQAAACESSPFSRIGTADEIASVVAFLCSEEASWVTGQVILVNGGGRL